MEENIEQGIWEGAPVSTPSLSAPPSDLCGFTNREALKPEYFGFYMEASLHKDDLLNHWPSVVNSTFRPSAS